MMEVTVLLFEPRVQRLKRVPPNPEFVPIFNSLFKLNLMYCGLESCRTERGKFSGSEVFRHEGQPVFSLAHDASHPAVRWCSHLTLFHMLPHTIKWHAFSLVAQGTCGKRHPDLIVWASCLTTQAKGKYSLEELFFLTEEQVGLLVK